MRGPINAICFLPNQRYMVFGEETSVSIWDRDLLLDTWTHFDHALTVTGLSVSPTGNSIASTSCDHRVIQWKTATGEKIREFYGHSDELYAVCFSPCGKRLVSAGVGPNLIVHATNEY